GIPRRVCGGVGEDEAGGGPAESASGSGRTLVYVSAASMMLAAPDQALAGEPSPGIRPRPSTMDGPTRSGRPSRRPACSTWVTELVIYLRVPLLWRDLRRRRQVRRTPW